MRSIWHLNPLIVCHNIIRKNWKRIPHFTPNRPHKRNPNRLSSWKSWKNNSPFLYPLLLIFNFFCVRWTQFSYDMTLLFLVIKYGNYTKDVEQGIVWYSWLRIHAHHRTHVHTLNTKYMYTPTINVGPTPTQYCVIHTDSSLQHFCEVYVRTYFMRNK